MHIPINTHTNSNKQEREEKADKKLERDFVKSVLGWAVYAYVRVCIYVYTYTCLYIYIYIYTYMYVPEYGIFLWSPMWMGDSSLCTLRGISREHRGDVGEVMRTVSFQNVMFVFAA